MSATAIDAGFTYDDLPALMTRLTGDEKHGPSATSTLDVIWTLYDRVLRVSPATVDEPDRDRFLLSKGHGPAAFYAVLAAKGFFPVSWLDGFGGPDSRLGYHPDRVLVPGVEIGSGSLGHGLGLGVGIALGLRAQGFAGGRSRWWRAVPGAPVRDGRAAGLAGSHEPAPWVVVLLGDAELDEGSNHEAIAYAAAAGLDRLTVAVVDNDSATHGWHGGVLSHFGAYGWTGTTVDGHDHDALAAAFTHPHPGRPHVVVARVERKYP